MHRVNVEVTARFDLEGRMVPVSIRWEDGHIYEVQRVLDMRRAASLKCGGQGIRYTVRVDGRQTFLFYDKPLWFVEAKD